MKRIQKIWNHPLYQEQFVKLQQAESERIFCNHTLAHFLDVARLAYIYSLEAKTGPDRELIYAAAFLHDIGRYQQLTDGIPHDQASAALAQRILPDCGFTREEINMIRYAISHHRDCDNTQSVSAAVSEEARLLAAYLYRADKQSRCCFSCAAESRCNWSNEKKNLQILL
ncbi:MAG: HD domain-containing protein [Candidatus Choladocola sp.]|nr:HD domain-containing protein [Candidatus Choladocola sp.]